MLGRLSLDQIPFHEPIIMGAMGFIIIGAILTFCALTYFRKWSWLWTEWLTTVDHKKIGVMYILVALVMLLRGFSDAIMMRLQMALASAGSGYLPQHHYDQVFTAHGVIMIFFMAMPFIIGLMNIIIPLQIGARDVAYPFLNSVSFWLFMVGVVLINLSLGIGEFAKTGWLAYESLSGLDYSPDVGMDYWIWSLQISGIGTLLSGVNFIATIFKKRAPGMTLMKMPIFTWTSLCSNILILASFPILAGTILLLTLDRYLGFNIFTNGLGGNQMMYVNLIWAWGHPEVYILILPCFGIYSEVVATFSKKRLFGYTSLVWATAVITILSFIVWLHHFFTMGAGANVNAFFGITTMIISVPTGVKIFNWLFTIYKGRLQLTNPVLWMLGFLFTFTLGGMTGVLLAVPGANFVLHNTEFVVAHFHNVIIGGVVFGVMAGYQYWFPKVFGFKLNEKLGNLSFAFWIIGFMLAFIPVYALGFMGMPRRVSQNINPEYHSLLSLAFVGAVLILFGILTTVVQLIVSIKQRHQNLDETGDPWDGRTLEWSMPSPPPEYNFAVVPQVESLDDFWEKKQQGQGYTRAAPYQDIHMPKNTGTGVIIGILASIFGFAMVWYIWWLAILSGVGIIAAMIMHSFNYDTEFNIPKKRVEEEDTDFIARVAKAEEEHVN